MASIKKILVLAFSLGAILVIFELIIPAIFLGGRVVFEPEFVYQVLIHIGIWTGIGLAIIGSYTAYEWLSSKLRGMLRRIFHKPKNSSEQDATHNH